MTRPLLALALLAGSAAAAAGQDQQWIRQFGSPGNDWANDVAVDSAGRAYVGGRTQGNLFGPSAGGADVFLAGYDAAGNRVWGRQFGTAGPDVGFGVAVDGAGHAYITGSTEGSLGGPNLGYWDTFLAKYDAAGTQGWIVQFGTPQGERGQGVAVDSAGNVYIAGYTDGSLGGPHAGLLDAYLAKYDAAGNQVWARQFGTPGQELGHGVAVDSAGSAYVTGFLYGSVFGPGAGGSDVFLVKYNSAGNQVWGRQLGSASEDQGYRVAVDAAGGVFVAGYTYGSLGGPSAGGQDIFLAKYDSAGVQVWVQHLGTAGYDDAGGVAVDSAGHAYLGGFTLGGLFGLNLGMADPFLAKYDAAGNLVWGRQFGTAQDEGGTGLALDTAGNAYLAGVTYGSFGGPHGGGEDVFLAKFGPPACYANCDGSTAAPVLNVSDFICFLNRFAAGDSRANCDGSTVPPVLNVADFICFTNAFAAGCP